MRLILLLIVLTALQGCSASKTVTLIHNDGSTFHGRLDYNSSAKGFITIDNGPGDEQFSGSLVVVDKPAASKKRNPTGPQTNQLPAPGAAAGSSTGKSEAADHWYAPGSKGSYLKCELKMQATGHGHGICTHSNGEKYTISF